MLESQLTKIISLIRNAKWRQSVVKELAEFLSRNNPISSSFFERSVTENIKLLAVLREMLQEIENITPKKRYHNKKYTNYSGNIK
ncbi:hypothetical protein EV200_10456 [Pedobacter psychrotolerans]|uniref:Uncharacterized protein n=1 Tax=Pedobacter psychrotolerans TaxID=1843235 RepID=A0A4R2HCR7_9SPHI|nr:hypothetical protein [Pedobacter psychrotolerans]TCO25021.1 hypothetical protein EV200_10456 [Pedobacter psychrotolerans]GGE48694.1 hypothetical protein GCM10011413_13520 [Pedobacter psychrotolerans]